MRFSEPDVKLPSPEGAKSTYGQRPQYAGVPVRIKGSAKRLSSILY